MPTLTPKDTHHLLVCAVPFVPFVRCPFINLMSLIHPSMSCRAHSYLATCPVTCSIPSGGCLHCVFVSCIVHLCVPNLSPWLSLVTCAYCSVTNSHKCIMRKFTFGCPFRLLVCITVICCVCGTFLYLAPLLPLCSSFCMEIVGCECVCRCGKQVVLGGLVIGVHIVGGSCCERNGMVD